MKHKLWITVILKVKRKKLKSLKSKVENVKFKKETKLDFDLRNCRSGFSFLEKDEPKGYRR